MRRFNDFVALERVRELLDYSPDTGEFVWTHLAYSRFRGMRAGTIRLGYRIIRIDRVAYPAHRLAWLLVHGRWPSQLVDHINRVKSDNRISNLREATFQQNAFNSKGRSASGIKGVYRRQNGNWYSEIRQSGRCVCLGTFTTKEEAASVFATAVTKMRGEFTRLA